MQARSTISAINNSSQILVIITKIAIGITTGGMCADRPVLRGKEDRSREEAAGTLVSLSAVLGIAFSVILAASSGGILRILQALLMMRRCYI